MPQFDLSSFVVQLVWLFVCFLTFYFVFSWKFLPVWASLLKIREKLQGSYKIETTTFEAFNLTNNINNTKLKSTQDKVLF